MPTMLTKCVLLHTVLTSVVLSVRNNDVLLSDALRSALLRSVQDRSFQRHRCGYGALIEVAERLILLLATVIHVGLQRGTEVRH